MTIYRGLGSAGSGVAADYMLDSDISNTSDTTLGDALVGGKRTDTSAQAFTLHKYHEYRVVNVIVDYAADGNGTNDDSTAFTNAEAAGKLTFIPKTASGYNLVSTVSTTSAAWLLDPSMTWANATDSGQLNIQRGFWTDTGHGANIWRFADRVFFGEAAAKFAGNTSAGDGGSSWFDSTSYPGYLGTNARLLSTTGTTSIGPYGIVSAVRASDAGQGVIAFGAAAIADDSTRAAWGHVVELQREGTGSGVYGIEIAAKNKANDNSITPNAQTAGVFGLWLAGGGDNAFGGSAVNPSTAGIVFLKNAHTWNTGIVFLKDSLTAGEAMALSSEGTGGAHAIRWYNSLGNIVFQVRSTATDTVGWLVQRTDTGLEITASGTAVAQFIKSSTPANYFAFYGSNVGGSPGVYTYGSDTDIDIRLVPKGAGLVRTGYASAAAATPSNFSADRYIAIKDSSGTSYYIPLMASTW